MGIIVDLFAGGGGASQGIFEALGRHPDEAVNHNPQAVAIHAANHPTTRHWCQDIWSVDPAWVAAGRPVDLLWASPDCTHHSKAKGGAPKRDEKRRDLALVISTKWVPALRPRLIILENVEEFQDWGPLDSSGVPVPAAKGETFRAFVNSLKRYGYRVEWRELVAADYGAPTTRKRLFLIARCDGQPITWPAPTHAPQNSPEAASGQLQPWRTAAEIIDWSLPCPSIFASSAEIFEEYGLRAVRPLAGNTLRRIAKGLKRFVLDNPQPFVLKVTHTTKNGSYDCFRGGSIEEPLPTLTTKNGLGVVAPFLTKMRGQNIGYPADEPVQTLPAGGTHHAVTMPFLQHVQHSAAPNGVMPAGEPLRTITSQPKGGGIALVAPVLTSYYGPKPGEDCRVRGLEQPLPTQTTENRFALVAAFLAKYYGQGTGQELTRPMDTVVTKDRFGLVTVTINGETWAIADIGLRMLTPRELLLAQGFPPSYIIDEINGKPVTKAAQVSMIGNSVCPPLARALVAANFVETPAMEGAAYAI